MKMFIKFSAFDTCFFNTVADGARNEFNSIDSQYKNVENEIG